MSVAVLPTLRTPRLTLRPLQESDADAVVNGVGNFDVSKWLSVVPYPYSTADAETYLSRQIAQTAPSWAICAAEDLVGVVSLENELGYWLARPAWGKGYGFEAVHAAVAFYFETGNSELLTSGYFEGNARSAAVLKCLGFQHTEIRKQHALALAQDVDCHRMELTRLDWNARQMFRVKTERLVLRPLVASDADLIVDLARPEVTKMLYSLKTGIDRTAAQRFISARTWQGVPDFSLAIEQDGVAIGYIATGLSDQVELYYALHPDYWGTGIMTEAALAFLTEVFDRFPIRTIVADSFTDNPTSARVLEKCGFIETGRDFGLSAGRLEPAPVITYALTRDNLKVPS